MASPRDPNEVDQTLLPGATPDATGKTGATAHEPPHEATIAHRVGDGATLIAAARPAPKPAPPKAEPSAADVTQVHDATRMPDATAASAIGSGTVVTDPDAVDLGATVVHGRTLGSGSWVLSNGPASGVSHDTIPTNIGGSGRLGSTTGTMVGRFALKGLHASGGLGEVFTARDTELNREVAVKRIKSRYADDPGSRRRFLTEAELTARLDHPGVVPVFGLVNDARGRPVYAMRFIRGETLKDEIERYHGLQKPESKDQKTENSQKAETKPTDPSLAPSPAPAPAPIPRTVAFRHLLSRFVYVCQAIGFAHERGIIHRDIKPANIMVGKFGEVLVVDWGLAKSLTDGPDFDRVMKAASEAGFRHDPESTELPSHMTMAGTAVGTPSYMPPEQAAGELDKVGPRSDVYSLGATLFAILTGRAPFVGKSALETLEQVKQGAFTPPTAVNADCPKPLEAIALKAMALDPANRYSTALDLAADVERWLSDEPVRAYPDPFLARLARWARRHPSRVAATVSLLVAGVLAAGGIAWAVHLGERETAKERDRATEQEKETARQRDLVIEQQKETTKQRDRAVEQEKKTKEEQERVKAARDLARQRYQKAVEAYGTLVHDLDGRLKRQTGLNDTRKKLLLKATEGLQSLIDTKGEGDIGADRTIVAAHRQMGEVYELIGESAPARDQYLKAVGVARLVKKDARPDEMRAADRDLARSLHGLAGGHLLTGKTELALDASKEAVAIFEALAADKADAVAQQELADARKRLSEILLQLGRTSQAATECRRAVVVCREALERMPDDLGHQRGLASALDALAGIQLRTGDTLGAAESAKQARDARLAITRNPAAEPEAQHELAEAHARVGEVHFDRALLTAAAEDYRAALAALDGVVVKDKENAAARAELAAILGRLGYVQLRTGDIATALTNTKASLDECEYLESRDKESAKAQRDLALARERYGDALVANGRAKEALTEYEQSLALLNALRELDPASAAAKLEHARGWERLGDGRLALGNSDGAITAFQESVKIRTAAVEGDAGSDSAKRDLAVGWYKLAEAHLAAGKPGPASKYSSDATKLLTDLAGKNPGSGQAQRDIALAYSKWGQVLAADGRSTVAAIIWQSALDRFQQLADKDRANVLAQEEEATAWERLAGFYATLGNTDHALASARKAVAVWTALNQRPDARTKAGQRRLALALIRYGDINTEVRQLPAAANKYGEALKEVAALKNDPLLGPVHDLAQEKLVFLDAVRAGLNNPPNLADEKYAAVRVAALRTVAKFEVRADHAVSASQAADVLAKYATTSADLFAVAGTYAGCANVPRVSDPTKDVYAGMAVTALKKAVKEGFHDTAALTGPEWDAVRRRAPALKGIEDDLAKMRTAEK